ncbi:CPBP family intramembrane metalloprotease [Mobilitalea sibirica]|uniref:CPBP family intramembrane metalloprotease n=1 Tax=Mobilitalea sibirica TaxID=1462919 RepID=A0A8J7HEE9_9FIRM|nr:CPBP family intramembrane glutamic endopeptidase [Mobilitalea sibirica]MBH1942034.1 CPBP family intramembrane metalloprotease [Mobilitalea sibirica]
MNNKVLNFGEILTILLFYPIAEELITRGILLNKLNKNRTFIISNIIQAFVFSILHFNINTLITFFIFGLLLGAIKRHGGILCTMVIHILRNFTVYIMIVYEITFPNLSRWFYLFYGILFFFLTGVIYTYFKKYDISEENKKTSLSEI